MRSIFLAVFLLCCSLDGKEVYEILQDIPSRDKQRIETLFSYLVQRDSLGFVLFGNTKTAAFCSIPIICNYPIFPSSVTKSPLKYQKNLKQCWDVWARYMPQFKHPNIIVCEEHDRLGNSVFLQLFFIDKKKLECLIENYQDDFVEILGENFSSSSFIAQLELKKKLRPLIKNDEKLLGLILGFGKESSSSFKDMNYEEENPSIAIVGSKPVGCCITPVSFKGNPDSNEVKELIEIYEKEILEIESIFKNECFLEITLIKFCAP